MSPAGWPGRRTLSMIGSRARKFISHNEINRWLPSAKVFPLLSWRQLHNPVRPRWDIIGPPRELVRIADVFNKMWNKDWRIEHVERRSIFHRQMRISAREEKCSKECCRRKLLRPMMRRHFRQLARKSRLNICKSLHSASINDDYFWHFLWGWRVCESLQSLSLWSCATLGRDCEAKPSKSRLNRINL